MVCCYLGSCRETVQSLKTKWLVKGLTRVLICFDTSSIPKDNLEMAIDMSSFAEASGAVTVVCAFDCSGGGYGSPARIAFAYSLESKSGLAKTE